MKRLLLVVALMTTALGMKAQEAKDSVAHILLEGIEVKGDIYQFSEAMKGHGYKLEKRVGDSNFYVFKGMVAGTSCYLQVDYSKSTRTVYRIMAQPKHVAITDYVDSLKVRYGEVFDTTPRGYQWQLPTGAVMLMTPDGADPTLVIVDAEGFVTFKDERDR